MKKKLLVINCFLDIELGESFDKAIQRFLKKVDVEVQFIEVTELDPDVDMDFSSFTHLLISGSEASVMDELDWDEPLIQLIRDFVKQKKAFLGICYGHQFFVKALQGMGNLRKSRTPEFGWREIQLMENLIFKGIPKLHTMVSHYDEVVDLPRDYNIIASTDRCGIHTFQYKDLPVWGVQFHPEYNIPEAKEIFEKLSETDNTFKDYFFQEYTKPDRLDMNQQILENFISAS